MFAMLELRLHRYPELSVDGRPVRLQLKRGLALLAWLSETAGPVSRGQAAQLLWPDADDAVARGRLRRLVHEVNTAAGREIVAGDADRIRILPQLHLVTDVAGVRAAAQAMLQPVPGAGAGAPLLMRPEAAQFLDGFSLQSDLFLDWLARHREQHERLVTRALLRLAELRVESDPALGIEAARRVLALDDCSEQAHAAIIRGLALQGDRAGAEAAYFRCAEVLRRELGVRPSPLVEDAYARISTGESAPAGARALQPAIRFAQTSDGAVAYVAEGAGPHTIVIIPGLLSHLEVSLEDSRVREMVRRLARRHRVILLDRRGTGLSERVGVTPGTQSALEDIIAVLDNEGAGRAWVLGASVGGTIGIEFAARHRERCAGLLLFGANARGAWAPDYPWSMNDAALERWIGALRSDWGGATSLGMFAPSCAGDPQVQAWWARMLRQAASPNSMASLVKGFHAMDVRALLPAVDVPALVVHREGDRIVRKGAGEYLAAHIPGARWLLLPGEDHFFWHGDCASVLQAFESFIASQPSAA